MDNTSKQVQNDVQSDPVIQKLQSVLTRESGRVSSATTGIEDTINKAINQTQKAGSASSFRIESQFNRAINNQLTQGQYAVDNFQESRTGFATQLAALRNLTGQTDQYIKDLVQQREEALALQDSQTASQISQLMVQGQQMKMDALQQGFANLLAVSNFGLGARQFELGQAESKRQFNLNYELDGQRFQLQKDQQSFAEKQAMSQVALQFGLEMGPTDTIDTLVERAAATGYVSEQQALQLEQMRASIKASNAQAAKALQQDPGSKPFDPITADILANAYMNGQTEFLAGLKTNEQYAAVIKNVNDKTQTEKDQLTTLASGYNSAESFLSAVTEQTSGMSEAAKTRITQNAMQVAANTTFTPAAKQSSNLPQLLGRGAVGYSNSVNNFLSFLTGIEQKK